MKAKIGGRFANLLRCDGLEPRPGVVNRFTSVADAVEAFQSQTPA